LATGVRKVLGQQNQRPFSDLHAGRQRRVSLDTPLQMPVLEWRYSIHWCVGVCRSACLLVDQPVCLFSRPFRSGFIVGAPGIRTCRPSFQAPGPRPCAWLSSPNQRQVLDVAPAALVGSLSVVLRPNPIPSSVMQGVDLWPCLTDIR
jgi:hypothetical protein